MADLKPNSFKLFPATGGFMIDGAIRPLDKAVLMYLAYFRIDETNSCHKSRKEIAQALRRDVKTIGESLKRLEEHGVIKIIKRKHQPAIYKIIFAPFDAPEKSRVFKGKKTSLSETAQKSSKGSFHPSQSEENFTFPIIPNEKRFYETREKALVKGKGVSSLETREVSLEVKNARIKNKNSLGDPPENDDDVLRRDSLLHEIDIELQERLRDLAQTGGAAIPSREKNFALHGSLLETAAKHPKWPEYLKGIKLFAVPGLNGVSKSIPAEAVVSSPDNGDLPF